MRDRSDEKPDEADDYIGTEVGKLYFKLVEESAKRLPKVPREELLMFVLKEMMVSMIANCDKNMETLEESDALIGKAKFDARDDTFGPDMSIYLGDPEC